MQPMTGECGSKTIQVCAKMVLLAAFALLTGCARATVSNKTSNATPAHGPAMVYVGKFELGAAQVKSDPGTLTGRPRLFNFRQKDPAQELERLSDLLSNEIVEDLNKSDINATRLDPAAPRPAAGWMVSGEFLEFVEGNRMQKAVLGFGAGNEDAKLYVALVDLSRPAGQNLLDFNVDSTGNKMPGGGVTAAATHSPWGMAAKFVLDRNASQKDIQRAAKQIADQIIQLAKAGK